MKPIKIHLVVLILVSGIAPLFGQEEKAAPRDVTMETSDNVIVHGTYYEGSEGKETVPFILVHGWDGDRSEFEPLAKALQTQGHAVLSIDLRGHGRSTTVRIDGAEDRTIDRKKFRTDAMRSMINDVQQAKRFLIAENNKGKLNIEMLCVVGAEFGSLVALEWALYDWSRRPIPAGKLGRDVKAIVLLSPDYSFKGLTASKAIRHPIVGKFLSAMLVSGTASSSKGDTKKIHTSLVRNHPEPPEAERAKKQDLFLVTPETSLNGTQLLTEPQLKVASKIVSFAKLRLVDKQDEFPWRDRSATSAK
ncbi:MAG: alpha-beta hydrolase superfamily lysophospholipase [Pirellulaceae bacterium]|jgi:alpha-beta hydrolase superfamily lysophospholipase